MPVRPILQWPDQRLRTAASPVQAITDDIRGIWDDMVATMDAMPGQGVGLAANQIGVLHALAVVDITPDRSRRILLANPSVLDQADELHSSEEASPCLPGVSAKIKRPARVTIRYLNDQGTVDRRDFQGLEARSILHQIDHLAGRMYFDNLSKVKRDMLLRKASKR
ncbi:MAG: peptide deformylase [Pseudomonadota bacterium]